MLLSVSLFLSGSLFCASACASQKQNCTRACTCTNVKWHGTGAGGNARVAKYQGWRRHIYRCTSPHSPLPLSFPLFPSFFPSPCHPPRPTPFFTSVCALRAASLALGNKHARNLATSVQEGCVGLASSFQVTFQDAPPSRCTTLVCGDNWSKQSGGKAMGSLCRGLCHAFAEAFATPLQRPLPRLCSGLCHAFAMPLQRTPESRNRNPVTRTMTHDGGHVHARARHRRAFGESLRSLTPFSPGLCCQQGLTKA